MKSLKIPSRLVTIIVTIIITLTTYVATMQPDQLMQYLPGYEAYAPIIIIIAAAIVNQYSEEKRVERAEQIAINKATTVLGAPMDGEIVLNEEYTLPTNDDEEDGPDGT